MDNILNDNVQSLHVGTIVQGKVKYITKLYSIVIVDTVKCVLPTSEMTWSDKLRCNVKMNDEIQAVVVKIENGQVMLSIKRLENNPWDNLQLRYKIGDQLKVSVVNITDIGAFVELEPGLRGLIHKKQLSFGLVKDPNDFVSLGQTLDAEIIELNYDKRRISLSILPFLINPWDNVTLNYVVGQILTRKIKVIQDYGVFVELEPGLDALYHRSEMNVGIGKKMKDLYNVGDSLTLEISMIDAENRKMSMKTPSKE